MKLVGSILAAAAAAAATASPAPAEKVEPEVFSGAIDRYLEQDLDWEPDIQILTPSNGEEVPDGGLVLWIDRAAPAFENLPDGATFDLEAGMWKVPSRYGGRRLQFFGSYAPPSCASNAFYENYTKSFSAEQRSYRVTRLNFHGLDDEMGGTISLLNDVDNYCTNSGFVADFTTEDGKMVRTTSSHAGTTTMPSYVRDIFKSNWPSEVNPRMSNSNPFLDDPEPGEGSPGCTGPVLDNIAVIPPDTPLNDGPEPIYVSKVCPDGPSAQPLASRRLQGCNVEPSFITPDGYNLWIVDAAALGPTQVCDAPEEEEEEEERPVFCWEDAGMASMLPGPITPSFPRTPITPSFPRVPVTGPSPGSPFPGPTAMTCVDACEFYQVPGCVNECPEDGGNGDLCWHYCEEGEDAQETGCMPEMMVPVR